MDGQTNGQTNRQNYINFEKNLAMMVIYVPVKFEVDWINRFRVKSGNKNVDKQSDGQKRTNNRRNFTNFERNLVMMVIYLPVSLSFSKSPIIARHHLE